MEYAIGGAVLFVWLSLGFGTRAILHAANNSLANMPVLPLLLWPMALMIAAYVPGWAGNDK